MLKLLVEAEEEVAGKRKEEEEEVNQVTGLLQAVRTRVKIVCRSRN